MTLEPQARTVRVLGSADRRSALLLEAIPLGAAAVLGLVILLVIATTPDGGWDQHLDRMPPPLAAVITTTFLLPASLAGLAALAFLVSGVGWITAGRAGVGVTLMILRFFLSLFTAVPLGPDDAGLLAYLPGFAFSLGVAAVSVAALAYSFRRDDRAALMA